MAETFISEAEIQKALDYLRDNATNAASAKASRVYLEEYRKSLKALIMKEQEGNIPIAAQEREAYADERYDAHLKALRDAVFEDEKHRFLMQAATAKIDAWRTQESSIRAAGRLAA